MKRIMIFLLSLIICFSSCKKDSNNTGGGNNNGGGTADIAVSNIAPAFPYPGDEITITGTGFNKDLTKDTVEFGDKLQGGFINYLDGGGNKLRATVVSATSSKLVIKAVDVNDYFDLDFNNFAIGNNLPKTRLRIKANGKTLVTDIVPFKHRLFITPTTTGDILAKIQGCTYYPQPGDSIQIDGSGFYKPCHIYVNGKEITGATVDSTGPGQDRGRFRLPKDIFQQTSPDDNCSGITATFKIVNSDGKSFEREFTTVASPPMVISSAKFDKTDYYYGADDHAMLTIKGYSLYSTTMIRISSSNGYQYEGPATGITGYPDQTTQSLSLQGLPAPANITTYNIQIKRLQSDGWGFAIASFKFHP